MGHFYGQLCKRWWILSLIPIRLFEDAIGSYQLIYMSQGVHQQPKDCFLRYDATAKKNQSEQGNVAKAKEVMKCACRNVYVRLQY